MKISLETPSLLLHPRLLTLLCLANDEKPDTLWLELLLCFLRGLSEYQQQQTSLSSFIVGIQSRES